MIATLLVSFLVAPLQVPSTPQFPGKAEVFSGFSFTMATWDVTGDGIEDLVTSYLPGYGAQLLTGDGQGSFEMSAWIETAGMGYAEFGDIDLDGRTDLLGFFHGLGSVGVSVVRSLPGGSFAPPEVFMTSQPSHFAKLGDLDGDGWPDAVIECEPDDGSPIQLDVCLNDGAGGLLPPRSMISPILNDMAFSDFDLDGDIDVAYASLFDSDLNVLLGQGDGTLVPGPTSSTGLSPDMELWRLRTGDFDEDGRVDLAAIAAGEALLVLGGEAGGLFVVDESLELGQIGGAILVGDFDEDGHQDVAFGRRFPAELDIGRGDGTGHLLPLARTSVVGYPDIIMRCDVDDDGHDDLLVHGRGSSQFLTTLFSPGCGLPALTDAVDVPEESVALAAADVDGDERTDLFSVGEGSLAVLRAEGAGDFSLAASVSLAGPADDVAAGDVDGDGLADAIVLSSSAGSVSLVRNLDGAFSAPQALPPTAQPRAVAVGDCNGDGRPEILAGCESPPGVAVWRNDGDGDFLGQPLLITAQAAVLGIAMGDLTGDGLQDAVAASPASFGQWSGVTVFSGSASQLLTKTSSKALSNGAQFVDLGDMDADGDLDVVAVGDVGRLYLLANLGAGVLAAPIEQDLPDFGFVVAVGDLDADGRAEASCTVGYQVMVLGLGAFSSSWVTLATYPTGYCQDLLLLDADGDEDLDIALRANNTPALPSAVIHVDRQLGPWFEVGPALAGPAGTPQLTGAGALAAGHAVELELCHAPAGVPSWLVLGTAEVDLPLHGGVLVPAPERLVGPLQTDPTGGWQLALTWPPGVPGGVTFYLQAWMPAAGGAWTASQGLVAVTP